MQGIELRRWGIGLAMMALASAISPAQAEVLSSSDNGFVVRIASEVTAPPAEAWKTVLTPARWWQSQHTFSGDAANLSLDPQVGGCFCEVLPPPEGAPTTQKPGGVQHMRVIYLEPPRALRLAGALGPLQSEALSATMTITVKPTEKGSRILFEYVVGGFMRYKIDDIAPAVDRMLTAQLTSLAGKLGPVAEPVTSAPAPKNGAAMGPPAPSDELPPSAPESKPASPLSGAASYSLPPIGSKPAPRPAPKPVAQSALQPAAQPPARSAPKPAASAKTAPAPAARTPLKSASLSPAKPVAKAPSKVPGRPVAKPAAKALDPEAVAHRDANAAFDAALSGAAPKP